MKLTILILFITCSLNSFSQHMITDSTFYESGKLESFGKYDSLNKYWRYYRFYETGKIELTRRLDPNFYWDVDTSIVYHRNGKVAWIFPYTDSGMLNGTLTGYYQDGSIKREAYHYRNFRAGTWKEYYQNGKTKSTSHYEITPEDSAFARMSPFGAYRKGRFEAEYFTWGEHDDTTTHDGFMYGPTRFTLTTPISKKTGTWETYDSTGKLRDKRLTDFENTVIVKDIVEANGLSFEKVKEMYEKSNSFEELAQMFEENIEGDNKEKLLKSWREADADFLETLNEPRVALGLDRFIFPRSSTGAWK